MVYVKKPENWSELNLYYWNTSPANQSVDWPGVAMTNLGDNWFAFQLPQGVNATNLIINDNSSNQTQDLYLEGNGCYDINAALWSTDCTLPGLKLYFKKPVEWTDNINMYYWNAEGVENASWPGVLMEQLNDDWFFYQMPDGVRSLNLIFNDASAGGTGG